MQKIFLLSLVIILLPACENGEDSGEITKPSAPLPELRGKMVYHAYSSYNANDSKMYLFDFGSKQLDLISGGWNIINPMNAHFSPDGRLITFMGIQPGAGNWSIYIYELGSSQPPRNLTSGSYRDEDPKFSPDGKRIAFKRNSQIAEMNLETGRITLLSPVGYSMPYYNFEGTKIVCSKDGANDSSIHLIDIQTRIMRTLYDNPGLQDYYPIGTDDKSFYYTTGYLPSNIIDQVYRGYWSGLKSARLPFNGTDGDYSDAYPVDDQWLILSSSRTGTMGGYDLYVANVETGDIYPLTDYHREINTSREELGAVYFK
ncbi:MAG: hypothetical protein LBE91_01265 [Tannerella sp.]|jgi:Tol biopolymer transport system component|nr:hypothetical protein [Tannerella sp.]